MNSTVNDDGMDPTGNGAAAERPGSEEALRAQLADVQAQIQQYRDDYLRVVAEMDNLRKRTAREIDSAQRYAVEKFAGDLLEVRDSLEMGIAAAAGGGEAARLQEGMQATLRLIDKAFERAGLTVLDPQGQPFNPERHEAMATQESPEQAPGTILAVVQKGYLLNGRVVRPARVLIAREPAN
jgi:molecular chaperone GrpE